MKVTFKLTDITGSQLLDVFATRINELGVGYEEDFNSNAKLSEDGRTWTTSWSRFKYTILNPESSDPALVEYEGAVRGFLKQNLLPDELFGQTFFAEVTEGSVVVARQEHLTHPEAQILVKAYQLMQSCTIPVEEALSVSEVIHDLESWTNWLLEELGWDPRSKGPIFSPKWVENDPKLRVYGLRDGVEVRVHLSISNQILDVTFSPHLGDRIPQINHLRERIMNWLTSIQSVMTPF